MKIWIKSKLFIPCVLLVLILNNSTAQTLPSRTEVMSDMIRSNQYFMNKWPDPGADIVHERARPSHIWTRATYYEGLMALYALYPDTSYYQYAVDWGESHNWTLYGGNRTRHADNHCAGQTWIELYKLNPEPQRIQSVKQSIDYMVSSSQSDDWWWIDALQMAMPVFAELGVMYNDTSYFEKMHDLYSYAKNIQGDSGLYNKVDSLWWRDKDFDPPTVAPNGEDVYWSRGNGWVLAALARVLNILPDSTTHRAEYEQTFVEMCYALKKLQRTDGFWNASLHDSTHFGGPESSGTAFFVYGMTWGINQGLLDKTTFLPVVTKGWAALSSAVHSNGFLGYVQGTGKEPADGQPVAYDHEPNFEDYGLGAFLLAASEVYQLVSDDVDCAGIENGEAFMDACGTCVGKNTQLLACKQDCHGEWGGTAIIDSCEQCTEGNTGIDRNSTCPDCNGDINGNAYVDLCGICVAGNTGNVSCTNFFEAEDACSVDGTIDNNYTGFSGRGFVNTENTIGSSISWNVVAESNQSVTLSVKYANGAPFERLAAVYLNAILIDTIPMLPTSSWTNWNLATLNLIFLKVSIHLI